MKTLYIVVPCYNEEEVLPETSKRLLEKLTTLENQGRVTAKSRILFIDDGSRDKTWEMISSLHKPHFSNTGEKRRQRKLSPLFLSKGRFFK